MNARAMKRLAKGLPNYVIQVSKTGTTQLVSDNLDGSIVALNVAGGATISMPRATGSGLCFWAVVLVVSTVGYVFDTDPTTDGFFGSLGINVTGSTATTFASGTSSNNILTLNGTTTGGVQIGDTIQFLDLAVGTWAVSGDLVGSGTVATPFS